MKGTTLIITTLVLMSVIGVGCGLKKQVQSIHKHSLYQYKEIYCRHNDGIMDFENPDRSTVDCYTIHHAASINFLDKPDKAIKTALENAKTTGLKPKIVIILEKPAAQQSEFEEVKKNAQSQGIEVESITEDYFKKDKR